MDRKKKLNPETAKMFLEMLNGVVDETKNRMNEEDKNIELAASFISRQIDAFVRHGMSREEAFEATIAMVCTSIESGGSK